jgi:hypothetical protein
MTSGETHYFCEGTTLIAWLLAMLPDPQSYPSA